MAATAQRGPPAIVVQDERVDSTRWDAFRFRDDDVVICTFGKTGTTWVQQIVSQLIFDGAEGVPVGELSPWIEYRALPQVTMFDALEAQTHRRFVKTHLRRDALPTCDAARFIYVAREPRDQIWSAHDHRARLASKPGGSGAGVRDHYRRLLQGSGSELWPYWAHVSSWWETRHLPNVLLVHFSNLQRDLAAEIHRIAVFLGIAATGDLLGRVKEHTEFDYMKRNAGSFSSPATRALEGGASALMNRGISGRWKHVLDDAEARMCRDAASKHLTAECAEWLFTGRT